MSVDEDLVVPAASYIQPEVVLAVMAREGAHRLSDLNSVRVFALAMLGGAFITVGALFSVLLATGASGSGAFYLLEGLGFSTGFFFVILSHGVLFTEANVVLPTTLSLTGAKALLVARFWGLAWVGNFVGALITASAIGFAQRYSPAVHTQLNEIVATKMSFQAAGGADSWIRVVISGMLANWLVGMAAFFALMGRTIFGKYIPVLLAVTAFVTAGFQHSPANMGFFSLSHALGGGPDWVDAFVWNLIPAGIGNMLGGALLVALPLSWAFRTRRFSARPAPSASSGGAPVDPRTGTTA
ncbi:MAG: formate/nitrite transporter family protein [Frankiales bacterium]|nr:formate/nitrite transporter family protein [Frankiales bacterium]